VTAPGIDGRPDPAPWCTRTVVAADGTPLRVGRARPDASGPGSSGQRSSGQGSSRPVRGHCLLLQGRGDHLEKHADAAERLRADGWDVLSLDWRGQGRSGRLGAAPGLSDVASFDDYLTDLDRVLTVVEDLPGPRVVLAHSMGSLIGLLHVLEHPTTVERAAMMSPMWGFAGTPPLPLVRLVAGTAGALGLGRRAAWGETAADPCAGVTGSHMATDDPDGRAELDRLARAHPDAVVHGSTWRWTAAAARAMARLRRADLSHVTTDVLVLSSPDDRTVDLAQHRLVAARLPRARVVEHRGGHDLLHGPAAVREEVWRHVLGHLAGAGAPSGRAAP
jgi:lysophospholipase